MLTTKFLKGLMSEARPIIERQLDDAELIAGLREVFTAQGGDWGALKALVKSQIQDERDEAGDGKRIRKLRDRSGNQLAYADMLGLGNMNEQNFIEDDDDLPTADDVRGILSTTHIPSNSEAFDPETDVEVTTPEITEQQPAPAARDLTVPQDLTGQVATHTPEMANEVRIAQAEAGSPPPVSVSNPAPATNVADSLSRSASFPIVAGDDLPVGETGANASKGVTGGERPATNILTREQGILKLRPNCQQPASCKSSGGKAHCWGCTKQMGATA